jgi:glycerol-3-phosphate acyltransferase PlsY
VSLASLVASAALFGLRVGFTPQPWAWDRFVVTLFCLVGTVLVFLRHHANIRRLVAGTEHRI